MKNKSIMAMQFGKLVEPTRRRMSKKNMRQFLQDIGRRTERPAVPAMPPLPTELLYPMAGRLFSAPHQQPSPRSDSASAGPSSLCGR